MAASPGDPGGYFRSTSRFWMGAIAISIGYFAWAVFLPSTIPYKNLGQFGHFTKYLVDNHPKLLYNGLSQIRCRRKRTRDKMFLEIMECTRNERAHLNEWKDTVSKYRKDASKSEVMRDARDEKW
ncbi:transmembrane protein 254 isoform X2 [Malaclemys terrapin pileata]|uniref:transmembrane protein 254 isoform X2 n=1 Tax=Malaclemys terrapin pileata TaxID=2991368 RepID=UPI0023A7AB1B|nr:transmembrane protein 254 isoform X2 [Malaclemys terrapin pileata]